MSSNLKEQLKKAVLKLRQNGFFHIFGSSIFNKVISFLSGIILVRIISKSDYGVYSYAHNIYGFFAMASGFGLASAMLQLCSEQSDNRFQMSIYGYCRRTGLKLNLLLAILMLGVSAIVPLPINGANKLLASLSFLPIFTYMFELQQMLLRSEFRNKEYSSANMLSALTASLLSVLLALRMGAYGLIIASYFAPLLASFYITRRAKIPLLQKSTSIDRETKKSLWGLSAISVLNNGLSSLMYLLDMFVIGLFIPDQIVIASYKVATTIPTALYFIPSCIMVYVYPFFARNKENKNWCISNYKKLTAVSAIINFSIALGLILLSSFVVPLLFGRQYEDAIPCFNILCLSFAFSGTFRIVGGNLLVTQRRLKFNLFVSVFSSAFNTVMNVIFVLRYGAVGAALATLLTVLVTSVMNTSYLIHVYRKLPDN